MDGTQEQTSTDEKQDATPHGEGQQQQVPEQDATDWKAEARKWEARAKANSTAAAKLAKLEEANKTELEKATEKASASEATAQKWAERYQQLLAKQAVYEAAQNAGAIDIDAIYALTRDAIEVGEDGEPLGVAQAVKSLQAQKPHLFRQNSPGAQDAFGNQQAPALNSNELENALRKALGG